MQGRVPGSDTGQRLALHAVVDELLPQHQCLCEVLLRILASSLLISDHILVVVLLVVFDRCYLWPLVYYLDQKTLIFSINSLCLFLLDL